MSPTQPTPCEAPLSNHHSLQLIQSNQFHFLHTVKALISHLKQSQVGHFNMQQIIKLNPMYWYITGFRRTVMWGIPLDVNMFLVCGICAVVSMVVGLQVFRKTQDHFVLHI